MSLPELYTCRYLAEEVLSSGEVVAVSVSHKPPAIPLSYPLERVEALAPERHHLGEWPQTGHLLWEKLEAIGPEAVARELSEISGRHGGKPLALCCWEDVTRSLECLRIVVAAWIEERLGVAVPELTNDGRKLAFSELPAQCRPTKVPPKKPEDDPRWREDPVYEWPLSHEQVADWVEGRYWQQARTRTNPHAYTVKRWGDPGMFELVCLHMREHGYEAEFAGRTYVQYDVGDHFYWTMGCELPATVIINRKRLPESEASEDVGDRAAGPRLFDG